MSRDGPIHRKFDVKRTDRRDRNPGDKHYGCFHWVLDIDHDPHAMPTMGFYAKLCKETHPQLSSDIMMVVKGLRDPHSTPVPTDLIFKVGPVSAFVLLEDNWWEQPVRRIDRNASEKEVRDGFQREYPSAIWVTAICEDPDYPEPEDLIVLELDQINAEV